MNFSCWKCADDGCLGIMVGLLIGLLYASLQLPLDNRENKNSRNVCLSQIRENIFPQKFLLIQYNMALPILGLSTFENCLAWETKKWAFCIRQIVQFWLKEKVTSKKRKGKKKVMCTFLFLLLLLYICMREILCVSQLFTGQMFLMQEILYAWRMRGINSVQVGDSLSMWESWQPWPICPVPTFYYLGPSVYFTRNYNTLWSEITHRKTNNVQTHMMPMHWSLPLDSGKIITNIRTSL